jgi:hypothetical protein
MTDAEKAFEGLFRMNLSPSPPEEVPKARLVFDRGNVYPRKPGDIGLFFAIPSWWRGFIFQVLSPPAFRLYSYICSQTDKNAIAIPTGGHAKIDCGLKHNDSIYAPIGDLVDLGFLMKETRTPIRDTVRHRNVYQRPSIEYTLLTLLNKGKIDGDLVPLERPTQHVSQKQLLDYRTRHGRIVRDALRNLLGVPSFADYDAASGATKKTLLIERLQVKVEELRATATGHAVAPAVGSETTNTVAAAAVEPPAPRMRRRRRSHTEAAGSEAATVT